MLAIIDYRAGNLTSVRRGLEYLNIPCSITSDPESIDRASGIVFPGVGAAGSAMRNLRENGLDEVLTRQVRKGKPMLGICLGSQIVLESSEENEARTLGLLPGRCVRFDPALRDQWDEPITIPHMGWNHVAFDPSLPLFEGIAPEAEFYFVHSYYPVPDPSHCLGTTTHGTTFCSVLGREGLWAVQFHPEKSGRPGLRLLANFYGYCA
jgi:glutamine amidotransferase